MKRKLTATLLCVAMMLSVAPTPVHAADPTIGELREAFETVTKAVNEMESLIGGRQVSTISKIFNGFLSTAKTGATLVGLVNGSVTFLKLVGLIKDPQAEALANIMHELRTINEKLGEMDKKLDDIADAVTTLQATEDFNARIQKALTYKSAWRNFRSEYMEKGLDPLMTQYNAMILNGLKSWCLDPGGRSAGEIDNSSLVLLYVANDEGGKDLYLTDKNGVPENMIFEEVIVLWEADMPGKLDWNAETCETRIKAVFKDVMAENTGIDTDQLDVYVADAYETLLYRIAAKEVNKDANFTLEVSRQFDNYCNHLFEAGAGLDACLKAMYLSHTFEYEISKELQDICNEMILETATYGTFASGVLTMSGFATTSDANAQLSKLIATLKALGQTKKNCVTGKPGYCYITNCELVYTTDTIEMSGVYKVRTQPAKGNPTTSTYLGYTQNPTLVKSELADKKDAGLVGDTNALLILYSLRANGIAPSHEYFKENIGIGEVIDRGRVLTSHQAQTTLGLGDAVQMEVYQLIGDYFEGTSGGRLNFSHLPEDCDEEDITYRNKMLGSLLDISGNKIASNQLLCAMAGYAENHWYWNHDEVTFMCGPYTTNKDQMKTSLNESSTYYGVSHIGLDRTCTLVCDYYFNALHCIQGEKLLQGGEYDPLILLLDENAELGVEKTVLGPSEEGEASGEEIRGKFGVPALIATAVGAAALVVAAVILVGRKRRRYASI